MAVRLLLLLCCLPAVFSARLFLWLLSYLPVCGFPLARRLAALMPFAVPLRKPRGGGTADRPLRVAVIGGGYLLKSGLEKRAEAQIHVQALEELGMSLEAEITPQVIDLEDRSITLSGNVEEQYAQWRQLLADIYAAEIGALDEPQDSAATPDTL